MLLSLVWRKSSSLVTGIFLSGEVSSGVTELLMSGFFFFEYSDLLGVAELMDWY